MIIRKDDIQEVCSKILSAVDSSGNSMITETLELDVKDNILHMAVTNREYFAEVKLAISTGIAFHATVDATLFLKLISQQTADTIELLVEGNSLVVKGNGEYKLPLVYDGENLLKLPVIDIENVTSEFTVSGTILLSILNYNSRELMKVKEAQVRPVQRLYYMDDKGAITFTTGACVNKFNLDKPIKVLLNNKIVKLFKLFKDEEVKVLLGNDSVGGMTQTKIKFETGIISITAIISSDDMVTSVPAEAIRGLATKTFPHSVIFDKSALLQTINRLSLFMDSGKGYVKTHGVFEFKSNRVIIYDNDKINSEEIFYINEDELSDEYTCTLNLKDLKLVLDSCPESHINFNFGDKQCVTIARGNIYDVIAEVIYKGDAH